MPKFIKYFDKEGKETKDPELAQDIIIHETDGDGGLTRESRFRLA